MDVIKYEKFKLSGFWVRIKDSALSVLYRKSPATFASGLSIGNVYMSGRL
jgi:hypothetical protein